MARRFAGLRNVAKTFRQTGLGTLIAGIAIGTLATALVAQQPPGQQPAAPAAQGQGQGQGRGRGPAGPPAPCGPQAQLPAELSKNVDPKSRCFEIRMYTADPSRVGQPGLGGTFAGGINELHQRFREKEVALFQKHGAEIVAVWQHLGDPNTLVWMLAYRDRAHRDDVWAKFGADPDWKALQSKYPVPIMANTFMMSASDYSPMK